MSDATSSSEATADVKLRRNALGLRHAIVISVAVMSPAASVFFNTIPQAGFVGAAIPLCYVIGFVLALLIANQYSEFSREIPSSGSAYTFVTERAWSAPGFYNCLDRVHRIGNWGALLVCLASSQCADPDDTLVRPQPALEFLVRPGAWYYLCSQLLGYSAIDER